MGDYPDLAEIVNAGRCIKIPLGISLITGRMSAKWDSSIRPLLAASCQLYPTAERQPGGLIQPLRRDAGPEENVGRTRIASLAHCRALHFRRVFKLLPVGAGREKVAISKRESATLLGGEQLTGSMPISKKSTARPAVGFATINMASYRWLLDLSLGRSLRFLAVLPNPADR